ncbi:class 1 fructose-bisphosphatase [Solirubrum puertoriconensis]|uniref:Fructose-1,6-bisphosphatase class 1 n=1 Tax=Solirubrum puertoriconensis TaxID=1751427 RepID=A0A9X0L4T7_SOLP1|nr:class 1 fructose-bisphosphatase [Solirubrum puertoriconensis]KUG07807.1 fructose 1,6-bisphosphatase [Solirubrum puertoriconensis]
MLNEDDLDVPVGLTLERYIMQKQSEHPAATGEFSQLLRDLALAAKLVNHEVNQAGLPQLSTNLRAGAGHRTAQTLSETGHERFARALSRGSEVCAVLSEQHGGLQSTGNNLGTYVVALDALEGDTNNGVNIGLGTLFSIYRRVSSLGTPATADDFLQGGHKLAAAGYVLYGASTVLVYTTGQGVAAFTFQPLLGEFYLSQPQVTIPTQSNNYSCNEGLGFQYPEAIQAYLAECKQRSFTSRYVGSLVADFHRTLYMGGVYLSPPSHVAPEGFLSVVTHCLPLAYLVVQAGGLASTGTEAMLDVLPTHLQQCSPLYIGSRNLVEELTSKILQPSSANEA